MKFLLFILLFATVGSVPAQMTLISASRNISASGSADAAGPGGPSTYSLSQTSSSQFDPFTSMVVSNASAFNPASGPNGLDISAMASSRASQDSTISSSRFMVSAEVVSESSSLLPTWPGMCRGEASSTFAVTFNVPVTQTFELTLDRFRFAHSFPTIEGTCSLSPVGGNAILNLTLSQFFNGQPFTGTLDADKTYLLNFFVRTISTTPDPFGELGSLRADMTFTVVPEPSSLFLTGLSLAALVAFRVKRHF